ncbi:phosphonate ABC transporter ATP-binding protein [Paenibacillus sp. J22TS3]|uniref:phosphonate ABC transporter ATP-binding protein n=1 Tax=Paenibacillus sp. J22TS3 TaxID=2807192 RepID=UPI001B256198|nr:ATP-binding cassette domain-containing protein [Paenibacillus sp. J22TS3]GIP19892.1 phosphonates import ATP-binding protein PhnC [Paenibacillus sp. J22TS3]
MIEVSQLNITVGAEKKKILEDINLQFEQGEMIGVVGPSGSGKSTLLRSLALRMPWNSGKYVFDGKEIIKSGGRGSSKFRSQFAYLEQNPELNIQKTALKNVIIGQAGQTPLIRRVTGMIRSDDYMGAMDELEKFGLLDKAHVKAGKLSGGERQRVAICRALVHGANLIAADEPVIGLDKFATEKVLDTLKNLCKEEKATVITVLPLELAEKYCTRLWGLNQGRLQWDVTGRRLTQEEKQLI